ncbi:MAG TPA: hypothetical protein VJU16_01905 [Planctomycetota bacterium]|nr:hypothetical protein [Planctomycetota bacterium]
MAVCFKCERVLSANGSCLYCGTLMGMEAAGSRGGKRVNWLRRILILALLILVGHFFFFTSTGRDIIRPVLDATGLSKHLST